MYCLDPKCPLASTPGIHSRGMDPWGSTTPLLYLVGEAPGAQEDATGVPFVGPAGSVLRTILSQLKIPNEAIRINNAIRCAPMRESGKIEHPSKDEMACCLPAVLADILAANPKVVVALGDYPKRTLLNNKVPITQIRGTRQPIQIQDKQFLVIPTFHPSYLRRQRMRQDLVELFIRDLATAWAIATGNDTQQVTTGGRKYRFLQTKQEVEEYVQGLVAGLQSGAVPYFVTDIESTSLNPHRGDLLCIGLSGGPYEAAVIPVDHYQSPLRGETAWLSSVLAPLSSLPYCNQNAKFDMFWLRTKLGLELTNVVFDPLLASRCLYQKNREADLEALATLHLSEPSWEHKLLSVVSSVREQIGQQVKELTAQAKKAVKANCPDDVLCLQQQVAVAKQWHMLSKEGKGYGVAPLGDLAYYCCIDCDVTYRLVPVMTKLLQEADLLEVYHRLYTPHIAVWSDIQYSGICLNPEAVARHKVEVPAKAHEINAEFNQLLPVRKTCELLHLEQLNMNSPPQMASLIYDVLGCPAPTDNRKGSRSTEAEVLETLLGDARRKGSKRATRCFELIQEYRSNTKILSSYIESPEALAHNGFIHPDWDIGGTDTGRASCKDPPVHSQPKTYRDIVTSRWKEHGGCILSFDQSQVEVRGFASLADDQFLIQTYNTPGADIHRMLASLIFGKQPQDISDDERSIAKTCVFASLYGGGPGRLAGQTGLPFDRAEAIHNRFTSIVSSEKYKERMAAFLFQNGYVTTPFGRKRTIPVGQTMGERNHAIRQAANTPIQSACSDISLESIGRLWYRMRQGGMQTKIIIWHHDAIVWDVYPGELFKLVGMADYAMRVEPMAMYSWLKVPLKIEGGLGLDWKNLLDIGTWTGDTVDVEGEEKDVLMLQRSGISEAYTVTLVESKAEEKKGKHVVITKATLRQR